VRAVRGGRELAVPVSEVLVGDLLLLEAGDILCADGLLVSGSDVKCVGSGRCCMAGFFCCVGRSLGLGRRGWPAHMSVEGAGRGWALGALRV
jgi:hypothetical protein